MKPMKLLIIEDDVEDCKNFIHAVKNRKDIQLVKITDSDIEGLQYAKIKHPDGIVLDLELNNSATGNTNAINFLKDLKRLKLNYEPIIIVTTHVASAKTYNILHKDGADLIMYKEHPKYSAEQVLNTFINIREEMPQKTIKALKEEMENEEEKISKYIEKELDLIGIRAKMKGREYVHDAILYLIKNENSQENVIRRLAKIYKKSPNTITNGIQNAIYRAWNSTAVEDLLEYYTARINPETGVPTTMEFIYYYVNKIKKEI